MNYNPNPTHNYICPLDERITERDLLKYLHYKIDGDEPKDHALNIRQAQYIQKHIKDGCEPCRNELQHQYGVEKILIDVFSRRSDCPDMLEIYSAEFGIITNDNRVKELLGHRDNCGGCSLVYRLETFQAEKILKLLEELESKSQ